LNGWLRRAGTGRLDDGATLVWSVAEGSRGRRWRAQRLEDGGLTMTVLLELDQYGRPSRLEVDTSAGLLTLHPDSEWQMADGNVVGHDGVRPLAFAWWASGAFLVDGMPIGEIATIGGLASRVGVGERETVPVLVVDRRLMLAAEMRSFLRLSRTGWRCDDEPCSVEIDGTPLLREGLSWELEAE
jgi:hypothetical protein